jgi:uncharacterized membrane protein
MFKKTFEKIAVSSALRVILTLLVGIFIGVKFPEGVQITCTVADILNVEVSLCENGTLQ